MEEKKKSILIVDDDSFLLDMYALKFSQSGFEVDTALGSTVALQKLKEFITGKIRNNLNPGNNKIIVFTAFADTAKYLYEQLSVWAKENLGLESALVTGSGSNQCTIKKLPKDLTSVLTAFSPRSKERPADFEDEGEIDLIFATDCISEGQNLQDCDFLVNYDIHWNPVRIIQRFGRIDRIGSPNSRIQLVNFWQIFN
jgi:ERCC4-related helicase